MYFTAASRGLRCYCTPLVQCSYLCWKRLLYTVTVQPYQITNVSKLRAEINDQLHAWLSWPTANGWADQLIASLYQPFTAKLQIRWADQLMQLSGFSIPYVADNRGQEMIKLGVIFPHRWYTHGINLLPRDYTDSQSAVLRGMSSVLPSVCDVAVLWSCRFKVSSKVIACIVRLWSSQSVAPNIINLVRGEHPKISGGIEVRYGKVASIQSIKAVISLKRSKIERKLLFVCL